MKHRSTPPGVHLNLNIRDLRVSATMAEQVPADGHLDSEFLTTYCGNLTEAPATDLVRAKSRLT